MAGPMDIIARQDALVLIVLFNSGVEKKYVWMIASALSLVHLGVRSRDHTVVRRRISPHVSVTVQGKLFPEIGAIAPRVLRFFKLDFSVIYYIFCACTKIKMSRAFFP